MDQAEAKAAEAKCKTLIGQSQQLDVNRQRIKKEMKAVQNEIDPLLESLRQHRRENPSPGGESQNVG